MEIPRQYEMNLLVLKLFTDGEPRTRKQAKSDMRDQLNLSKEQIKYRTSSGVPVYESRVSWSISHLNRAGILQSRERGVHEITSFGLSVADEYQDSQLFNTFLKSILKQNENSMENSNSNKVMNLEMGKHKSRDDIEEENLTDKLEETSPQERLDEVFSQLNDELQKKLLDIILDKDPDFFEQLVVDLLVKMGYGQEQKTQTTNDHGIDGIIATDALGFDPILIQAKRYDPSKGVGRPELQGFAGALGATKRGVFITTSSFSKDAVEWAVSFPHATLVLIDGKRLTDLMIKHDLGVSTEQTYHVKRINIDYFEDE